jgi:hypothetical protein
MHGNVGDGPSRSGSPMPPAFTKHGDGRGASNGDGRLAPPFIGGPGGTPRNEPPGEPPPISASSGGGGNEPWETPDEGVVEPAFQADTDAALAELDQQARREDFPLDAFIVPEETRRMPAGMEGQAMPAGPEPSQVTALADRLEKLSHRLRVEETGAMLHKLARGDRLDALLAGLLAGYLAGSSEQD